MPKYKIDDIVCVTGDRSVIRADPIFVNAMERFAGKNAVVTSVDNFGTVTCYQLMLCENGSSDFFWFHEMSIIGLADDYADDIVSMTPEEICSLIALANGEVRT